MGNILHLKHNMETWLHMVKLFCEVHSTMVNYSLDQICGNEINYDKATCGKSYEIWD